MKAIIIGSLPPAQDYLVELCMEHRAITQVIKQVVNTGDRNNPSKQQLDDYTQLRQTQINIERETQRLFNNN